MKKSTTQLIFLKNFVFSLFLAALVACAIGCAAQTSREKVQAIRDSAKHKAAADYMDGFWLDYRSPPDREAQHWDFYYKHCTLMSRNPWPNRSEYECTGPR